MDVGKFKTSRLQLIFWLMIPPALIASVGLSSYALRLHSEWQLNLTDQLANVLPAFVYAEERSHHLLSDFQNSSSRTIRSEDQMISYLQEAAFRSGFTINSLKVERSDSDDGMVPLLKASVLGEGQLGTVEQYLSEISTGQLLLSENVLKLSRSAKEFEPDSFQTEIEMELMLFSSVTGAEGVE